MDLNFFILNLLVDFCILSFIVIVVFLLRGVFSLVKRNEFLFSNMIFVEFYYKVVFKFLSFI